MNTTSKNVKITGLRLEEFLPTPQVVIEFDDGSEIIITECSFNTHGFKLRDEVTISISDTYTHIVTTTEELTRALKGI